MLRIITVLSFLMPCYASAQESTADVSDIATGLAQIMARADKCGYELAPEKVEAYYVSKGLATPDTLAWISQKVAQETGWADETTATECAITKATAQSLGLLK